MKNKIRIGVIGCGKQAPKHITGLLQIPGVELVLTDINKEVCRSLAEQSGLPWVSHPDKVFSDPSVRAVVICTPTPSHVSLIRQAVESGKEFFCEKPLTDVLDEARDLTALVKKNGRVGQVGYVYRFVPVFELGKRLFEDISSLGESMVLGRPVASYFRLGGRGSHQEWKHRKELGGGAINEMLVHMVDLAIWYFGPVRTAEVLTCDILRPFRIIQGTQVEANAEDYVVIRLRTVNGVEILCQADLVTPAFTQLVEIQAENGTFMGSIQQGMPSFLYCIDPRAGYQPGQTSLQFALHKVYDAQMAEFVRSVMLQIQPTRCTVEDSVLLLEALEKLQFEVPA